MLSACVCALFLPFPCSLLVDVHTFVGVRSGFQAWREKGEFIQQLCLRFMSYFVLALTVSTP